MAPKSRSSSRSSVFPVTMFAHLLFIAVTTLVLVWLLHFRDGVAFKSDNKQRIFNLHPLFMVIGFVLISGEAMMVYKTIPAPRMTQKIIHMTLNFIALLAGIVGIIAVFKFHHDLGIPDIYTLHSWFGITTISLFGLQYIFGFASFLFPRVDSSTRAKFTPWHILFGLVIFFMAILSAVTGLVEKFIFLSLQRNQESLIVNFTGLLIFLFGISVFFTVLHRYW